MKSSCRILLAVLFLLSVFPLSLRAQSVHKDLKSGKRQISSIFLMPVQAQLTKVSMKGGEPMIEESMSVQQRLTVIITQVLAKQGFTVYQQLLHPSGDQKDAEILYTVDDLQKKFDALLKQMQHKSGDVREGRFSLGDDVTKVPATEHADALLFVRASGQVLTDNKKTFDFLFGGSFADQARIYFAVVDSKNGEVLYFAKPRLFDKNLATEAEETEGSISGAFKELKKLSHPSAN